MDAYIYIFMYIDMVGSEARLFFFLRAERRYGYDENGKVFDYKKIRLLLRICSLGTAISER
jgi:hypothetical protein